MELPKNITQIGEVGRDCKIYVEDYAISYMKQLNKDALSGNMAVALYGRRQEENGVSYHFVYGACKLSSVGRQVRHLSQAQLQEIERLRRKNFPDLEFLGYRILDGEMIEGMHLCEQGICRYIGGYARFYEKNDAMLAHMLDARESPQPEQVDLTKYEEVKKRQDERREALDGDFAVESRMSSDKSGSAYLQKMRFAAVGAFALLCLWGVSTFGGSDPASDSEPDAAEVAAQADNTDTLLMEERLEQALLEENRSVESELTQEAAEAAEASVEERLPEETAEVLVEESVSEENVEESAAEPSSESSKEVKDVSAPVSQEAASAVAYIIQPGDTLITISWRQYGTGVRVADICALNNITDPDDIKEGQVIMLPQ